MIQHQTLYEIPLKVFFFATKSATKGIKMAKGKLITSTEAGHVYNMSKETVKKLVRRLNVKYGTSRGEYLFDKEEFDTSYLENCCRTYDSKRQTAQRRKKKRDSDKGKIKAVATKSAK